MNTIYKPCYAAFFTKADAGTKKPPRPRPSPLTSFFRRVAEVAGLFTFLCPSGGLGSLHIPVAVATFAMGYVGK